MLPAETVKKLDDQYGKGQYKVAVYSAPTAESFIEKSPLSRGEKIKKETIKGLKNGAEGGYYLVMTLPSKLLEEGIFNNYGSDAYALVMTTAGIILAVILFIPAVMAAAIGGIGGSVVGFTKGIEAP